MQLNSRHRWQLHNSPWSPAAVDQARLLASCCCRCCLLRAGLHSDRPVKSDQPYAAGDMLRHTVPTELTSAAPGCGQ